MKFQRRRDYLVVKPNNAERIVGFHDSIVIFENYHGLLNARKQTSSPGNAAGSGRRIARNGWIVLWHVRMGDLRLISRACLLSFVNGLNVLQLAFIEGKRAKLGHVQCLCQAWAGHKWLQPTKCNYYKAKGTNESNTTHRATKLSVWMLWA